MGATLEGEGVVPGAVEVDGDGQGLTGSADYRLVVQGQLAAARRDRRRGEGQLALVAVGDELTLADRPWRAVDLGGLADAALLTRSRGKGEPRDSLEEVVVEDLLLDRSRRQACARCDGVNRRTEHAVVGDTDVERELVLAVAQLGLVGHDGVAVATRAVRAHDERSGSGRTLDLLREVDARCRVGVFLECLGAVPVLDAGVWQTKCLEGDVEATPLVRGELHVRTGGASACACAVLDCGAGDNGRKLDVVDDNARRLPNDNLHVHS